MDYVDKHFIDAALAGGQVVFTRSQINAAVCEMRSDSSLLQSSVEKFGFTVGHWPEQPEQIALYIKTFPLGNLASSDDGQTFALKDLAFPAWLLYAIGTPLEERAKEIALTPSDNVLEQFQAELKDFGLIETTKKSMHFTARALKILDLAGLSMSSRLLTIVERYHTMVNAPGAAPAIAELDKNERAWKKSSKTRE